MQGILFYIGGVGVASGIFFRSFFNINFPEILALAVIGLACFIAWQVRGSTPRSQSILFVVGVMSLTCALGMLRLQVSEMSPSTFQEYAGEQHTFQAVVVSEPEVRETTAHLYVDPIDIGGDESERILVSVDRFSLYSTDVSYGDTISVTGSIEPPKAFDTDTGRVFDYPGFLKARGVEYVVSYAKISITEEEQGTLLGYVFKGKDYFEKEIEEIIPEPQAGLGEGVLLGVKRAIGKDLEDVFRETGIIHIVVLSGYNIMLVVEGVMFALSFLFVPKVRMIMGIGIIILFAILVGLSATVVRASVMAGLLIVARSSGRVYAVLRALMITGVGMLLLNPYLLVHDPGFQLSFLATLGLILLSPFLESKLTRIPSFLGVRGFVTATLATQIFVLPLLLFQMGTLSIVSVLVNVLVLPMVPIAMFFTFLTGVVGIFSGFLGMGVGYVAYLTLGYIITVAEFFGRLPFASFQIDAFPFWIVLCLYAGIAVGLFCIFKSQTQKRLTGTQVADGYDDWVIVTEKEVGTEIPSEVQSTSEGIRGPLPFR